jgi:hypothetical protein
MRPRKNAIFAGQRALDFASDEIDLEALRRTFSGLFDEACEAVTRLGLDLDDVTVERCLMCAHGGCKYEVLSPPLADRDRLLSAIREAAQFDAANHWSEILVLEACVRVFREVTEIPLTKREQ